MTFSELNSRPGDSPSSPAIAPPRDFKVINADELAEVICKEIHDPEIAALGFTGAIDQFSALTAAWARRGQSTRSVESVSLDRETGRARPS